MILLSKRRKGIFLNFKSLLLGCSVLLQPAVSYGGDTTTITEPMNIQISVILKKVSGDYQYGPPDEALSKPFVVKVTNKNEDVITDLNDNPIPIPITFKIISQPSGATGAGLSPNNATEVTINTNSNGEAKTILTLGNKSGIYKVEVTSNLVTEGSPQTFIAIVPKVDLDVDADRDGVVEDNDEDDVDEDKWSKQKGAVIINNNDDDNKGKGSTIDNINDTIDGDNDVRDLAKIVIRKVGNYPLPTGWKVVLSVSSNKDKIRIFDKRTTLASAVIGPAPLPSEYEIPNVINNDLEYGIEATQYPSPDFNGEVTISLILRKDDGSEVAKDEVKVKVAPFIMLSNLEAVEKVYVVKTWDNEDFISALTTAVNAAEVSVQVIDGSKYKDRWAQDEFEIGYARTPQSKMHVVLDSPRDGGLDGFPDNELLGSDFGHMDAPGDEETGNSFGNLEVSPPIEGYPLGRIYVGNSMHPDLISWLRSQHVQTPIVLDTNWLRVGHVDEIMSFVPANNTPKKFKMLFASTQLAKNILIELQNAGKGNLKLFEGKSKERTINEILADTTLMDLNDTVQKILNDIRSKLKTELALQESDIIDIPVLFTGSWGYVRAYVPNMVNLLVVNGHAIIAKPFGPRDEGVDKFEEYVKTKLENIGLTVHFIDDWKYYHLLGGEVHCGTNAKRIPPADVYWWEHE